MDKLPNNGCSHIFCFGLLKVSGSEGDVEVSQNTWKTHTCSRSNPAGRRKAEV